MVKEYFQLCDISTLMNSTISSNSPSGGINRSQATMSEQQAQAASNTQSSQTQAAQDQVAATSLSLNNEKLDTMLGVLTTISNKYDTMISLMNDNISQNRRLVNAMS